MNVKELKSKKMYKEYSIVIPYNEVSNSIDNKINELIPKVEIPGFRKGKAPLNIVKKKYENNVLAEVIENLAKENIKKIIDKNKFNVLRQPKVEIAKYDKDQPLEIILKIDLAPEMDLMDFKKLKTNKYIINIEKKYYEENYKKYIKSQKFYTKLKKDRPIKLGDKIVVNMNTNDQIAPDFIRQNENLTLYTDSDYQILPDISNRLIEKKLKINDKISLSFDIKEILKQKNKKLVDFEIEILSIEEQGKFDINKEFLEKNNLKSEKELKDKINENYKMHFENSLKEIEKKQLYDLLETKHNFDIPEGVYDEEFNQIWKRVETAKKDGTIDEDDKKLSEPQLKKRYEKIATRRVKLAIIIQKIAEKNSVVVSNDELSNGLLQYASQYPGQEKQIFEYIKKNPSQIETIRAPLFENKVLESVLAKTLKENKTINMNEFNKLQDKTFSFKQKEK